MICCDYIIIVYWKASSTKAQSTWMTLQFNFLHISSKQILLPLTWNGQSKYYNSTSQCGGGPQLMAHEMLVCAEHTLSFSIASFIAIH